MASMILSAAYAASAAHVAALAAASAAAHVAALAAASAAALAAASAAAPCAFVQVSRDTLPPRLTRSHNAMTALQAVLAAFVVA
jgi:hypothetical protein